MFCGAGDNAMLLNAVCSCNLDLVPDEGGGVRGLAMLDPAGAGVSRMLLNAVCSS